MKYILEDLLQIRQLRERESLKNLKLKKKELENAILLIQKRKDELTEYITWRIEKENELYDSIINMNVSVNELNSLRESIAILKEKDLIIQKKILDAEEQKKKSEKEVENAKILYSKAVKDTKKIAEHKKIWIAEMQKNAEKAAEAELEDLHFKIQTIGAESHE